MRHAKNQSTLLVVSHQLYKSSLVFYPKDLRSDFGGEMIEVFREQAREAYSRNGFAGLLRVWSNAMREIVTVAFRGRLVERMVPVVGVTATLAFMLWFASYISHVMQTACSGCSIH